uniref:ATFYPP3 (FLOWER-SPECIFIC, PHYTOCHROME-ASSOCIATED PROTEIN PHOSPHATASE 3) n=1 Tax=Arundo donax TaxID=35708 RepID=A0A0A9E0N5_ARUDO
MPFELKFQTRRLNCLFIYIVALLTCFKEPNDPIKFRHSPNLSSQFTIPGTLALSEELELAACRWGFLCAGRVGWIWICGSPRSRRGSTSPNTSSSPFANSYASLESPMPSPLSTRILPLSISSDLGPRVFPTMRVTCVQW